MRSLPLTMSLALLLAACTNPRTHIDPYREYLSGIPVEDPNGCVAQAAIAAGKSPVPPVLKGVWWDCGHVAKASDVGRIARLVAGGAFGINEFVLANMAANYTLALRSDGLIKSDRAKLQHLGALAQVLSHAPPMTNGDATTVKLPATYDKAGLLRIPVNAGGNEISAVLDTSAVISVLSESLARKLRLQVHQESSVATTWTTVPDLKIGGASFRNALFLVVPDQTMGLRADDTMGAIVGQPILRALETVCVSADTVTFAPFSPYDRATPTSVDLRFLDGVPSLSVKVNGSPLAAYLDSVATVSKLPRRFAVRKPTRWGFGTSDFVLDGHGVALSDPDRNAMAPHAAIGQDLLRKMGSWKLDYFHARFEASAQCL